MRDDEKPDVVVYDDVHHPMTDPNDDGSARHHVLGFALDLHTSVTGSCDADPAYIDDAAARLRVTLAKWYPSENAFDAAVRTLAEIALREHDDGRVARLTEDADQLDRLARHAATHRAIGPCRFCGAMACTGNVWPCQDRWRQVVCPNCRSRGPARPGFEEAIAAWQDTGCENSSKA